MTKIQDIAKILAEKHDLKQKEAENFILLLFDVVNEGLHNEKLVKVKGLGTFKVTTVKNRESVDVNTGERIIIEGRDKINFTPDSIIRDFVNKPFSQFDTVVINEGVDISDIEAVDVEEKQHVENTQIESENNDLDNKECAVHEEQSKAVIVPLNEEKEIDTDKNNLDTQPLSEEYIEEDTHYTEEEKEHQIVDFVCGEEKENHTEETKAKEHSWLKMFVLCFLIMIVSGLIGFFIGQNITKDNKDKTNIAFKEQKEHNINKPTEDKKERSNETISKVKKTEKINKKSEENKEPQKVKNNSSSGFDSDKYDKLDARVRTGAYRIVGVHEIVVVKKGQTLKSISKTFLGNGMECYLEVINGGIKEVKEGDKIKIPELKLRHKV